MQGKGIVRFFLVLLALVTLYQYLLILPTNRVENAADAYAQEASQNSGKSELEAKQVYNEARTAFLDSMSTEKLNDFYLLKSYTYQDLKASQLALGLDLKGGMSVVMRVNLRDFIRALANDSRDSTFTKALEQADAAQTDAQSDYVTLFGQEFNKIANGKSLASIFQVNESLRDDINFNTTNDQVLTIVRAKADETVDLTYKLLKERIDRLGVIQPNISLDKERDLILVELPGVDNPERARNILSATAKLDFWNVYRVTDPGVANFFGAVNNKLRAESGASDNREMQIDTTTSLVDGKEVTTIDTTYTTPVMNNGPLFDVLTPNNGEFGMAAMGVADKNKKDEVMALLDREDIKAMFPGDVSFHWAAKSLSMDLDEDGEREETTTYVLYALKKQRDGKAPLTGEHITTASVSPDPTTGEITVNLSMDDSGARVWAKMTEAAANDNNREVAIMLDGEVVSAPSVNGPIPGGNTQVTGGFSMQEATDLANILQIGRLPAETEIVQEALVGPSLGKENIKRSINALAIGLIIVLLFMVFYYGGGGLVSIISLLLNLFFIFGILASMGAVLTLPGIAGIVLTIGMAVDANVIIFERIREELNEGKELLAAIVDGFKHSYSAIIDANVTTFLTAMVLAYFGLGPIKGFAVVLMVGVLTSLFTAVMVGRLIIEGRVDGDKGITFSTNASKGWFSNMTTDWLGKRKMAYMISGAIIVMGIGSFVTRGFELGVDFKGGYSYNVEFTEGVDLEQLRSTLTTTFDGNAPVIKAVDTDNTYNVVVSDYLEGKTSAELGGVEPADFVVAKLMEGVQSATSQVKDLDNFKNMEGTGAHITSSNRVGPTIADDIQKSALYATVFALLLIFLYIFLRFSRWQFSMGAVAALFHDTLIVLSVFSLLHGLLPFSMQVDQAFIAAILTVIGYSINDTVVVFDRIREYVNKFTEGTKKEVVNAAINSTVSRTVITSLTTLFVVAVLLFFGGASIKGFAFAIFVGIIVGTYSSIFIATPVMFDLTDELKPRVVVASTTDSVPVMVGDNMREETKTFTRRLKKDEPVVEEGDED